MNTATGYTRVNLTIPKDIIAYLKRHTANMSSYISEAVRERIAREKREKALREILAAKATFRHGAEIISRFISACIMASAPEHFSGRITHCLKHVAA